MNIYFILFFNVSDDPEFWQDAKSDAGHRRPVMFFQVVYMAPRQPDVYPYYVNVTYTRVSEVGCFMLVTGGLS